MVGPNYSSKFSPWLSAGCLSPRLVHAEVRRYEGERVASKETYWMIFELTVRDYFRFYASTHGSKIFKLWGPKGQTSRKPGSKPWTQDLELFERWRLGTTGNLMIDANMRELLLTGWMSNRGRQIVASYLTRDLNLDWRLGAMWFESILLDHDVCANWGNWTYGAGVGADPREDRYFSIPRQTHVYDPEHEFIRLWMAEDTKLLSKAQITQTLTRGCRAKTWNKNNTKAPARGKKGNGNPNGKKKGRNQKHPGSTFRHVTRGKDREYFTTPNHESNSSRAKYGGKPSPQGESKTLKQDEVKTNTGPPVSRTTGPNARKITFGRQRTHNNVKIQTEQGVRQMHT